MHQLTRLGDATEILCPKLGTGCQWCPKLEQEPLGVYICLLQKSPVLFKDVTAYIPSTPWVYECEFPKVFSLREALTRGEGCTNFTTQGNTCDQENMYMPKEKCESLNFYYP